MLRTEFTVCRAMQIAAFSMATLMATNPAKAGFFDFLFQQPAPARQAAPQPQQPASFDPFGQGQPAQQPPSQYPYVEANSGRASSYCVRTCDGRYFPIQSSSSSAAQVCQSFCPASVTKVFYGNSITGAQAHDGARYGDLANAFLFRQKLVPGCTCNGRDGMGLAPVDLSLDQTLRSGDVIATTSGFVAYNGSSDFTPVNAYAGLGSDARTKLGATKIAPTGEAPDDITAAIPSYGTARVSESNAVR